MKKLLVGIVLGAVALAGARFLLVRPEPPTHYHANFAIFVDGDRLIRSGDRLLISYGPESAGESRDTRFPAVAADVEKHDRADDPSACSGQEAPGLLERIERAFLG